MGKQTGTHAALIQSITDQAITLNINGEIREIKNELLVLKELLETKQVQTIQNAENIYNIGEINEANFGFVTGKKAYNEILTRKLILALKVFNPYAAAFHEKAKVVSQEWETNAHISDKAKEIIASSFVGILGIQLRKLMAIGKEDASETKQRRYIENCLLTSRRALQLVCFTLLSELWNRRKTSLIQFNAEQRQSLAHFFDGGFELTIKAYIDLLSQLYAIYTTNQIPFPLTELEEFGRNLEQGSDFLIACNNLNHINEKLDKDQFTALDCFGAEEQLTTVLVSLIFFANYKMISIKSIGYDEIRNTPPRYLHYYTALGIDGKSNINAEKVNYVPNPVSTDAILLFKGRYEESVNLFPFIIDYNALTFENGAKICLYSATDILDNNNLTYRFLDDNTTINIVFKGTVKENTDWNDIMMDREKRKSFKLDLVYKQFQEARDIILES